ncbi:unnamed protein product, partial [Timema podura]|nr:unnamed protein product [Timema podura]
MSDTLYSSTNEDIVVAAMLMEPENIKERESRCDAPYPLFFQMTDFGGEGLSDKSSARVLQVYVSNNLSLDEGNQGTVNYTTYIGFALFSFWAWNVICAPDVFSWNFSFMFLNLAQLVYIIYQMRPVKFDPELEEAYQALFYPFKVSRLQFKKMVSFEFAQIMSLHAGEAYAIQNLTCTDRLGLLLSGKPFIRMRISYSGTTPSSMRRYTPLILKCYNLALTDCGMDSYSVTHQ